MSAQTLILLVILCAWAAIALASNRLVRNPKGDIWGGLGFAAVRFYARVFHQLKVEGIENVPTAGPRPDHEQPAHAPFPLIVVANHTAGIDPLLIQINCPFWIRWMMASDMRIRALDPVWEWVAILFVGPVNADEPRPASADLPVLKETLRHLKRGGVLGIFPEGRIARPRGILCPFQPGVGYLIAKSGAKVLPVVITGTPQTATAWRSLFRLSRSRIRFMPVIDYTGTKPEAIVTDLHNRYRAWTGWVDAPIDEPPAAADASGELNAA